MTADDHPDGIPSAPDRPRHPDRPRPPQGRRPRPRARLLLRRARLRADAALRRRRPPSSRPAATTTTSASTPGRAAAASRRRPGTTGLYHLAILYPTRAALADALRRLIAAGIPLDGASDHGVSEALYLRDPDENGVELYWDRPERRMAARRRRRARRCSRERLDLDSLLGEGGDEPPAAAPLSGDVRDP